MVSCNEETSAIAEEIADSKERIWRHLTDYKEEIGNLALKGLLVELIDMVEMETGGDERLLVMEGNCFESAHTETNEIADGKEKTNEIAYAREETNEIAYAREETNEIAEAREEMNEIVEAEEEANEVWAEAEVEANEVLAEGKYETNEVVAGANEETNEMTEAKGETNERAVANEEANETAEIEEETNDIAEIEEGTNEVVAKGNEETKEVEAKVYEEERSELIKVMEEIGEEACNKLIVTKLISLQEMVTVGDEPLFPEENSYESAQRVNALDPKLGVLHDECAKSAVEWCINKMSVGYVMDFHELMRVVARLGGLSKDCGLLLEECAKSAAELCIKKMRFGALVDKLDKRKILESEIIEARRMKSDLIERVMAFKRKLTVNNVGGAVMDDKFKMMECALCDEKAVVVRNINDLDISSFASESLRVLLEMVNGYKFGEIITDQEVDEAIASTDKWFRAVYWKCIFKACVGVLVEKHSIAEVLKSEIAEAWRMEKEVKDRLVIYQRKHAHAHAQGSVADIVEVKNTFVGVADKIKHLVDRVGLDLHLHKVGLFAVGIRWLLVSLLWFKVVGGDEGNLLIDGFGLVWQTVGLLLWVSLLLVSLMWFRVVGGDERKHLVDGFGLLWQKVGLSAAGIIAVVQGSRGVMTSFLLLSLLWFRVLGGDGRKHVIDGFGLAKGGSFFLCIIGVGLVAVAGLAKGKAKAMKR